MKNKATIYICTNVDCDVYKFNEKIGDSFVGSPKCIYLGKGKHRLSFVSRNNISDRIELEYIVNDIDYEDIIDVDLLQTQIAREHKEEEIRKIECEKQELERKNKIEELNRKKDKIRGGLYKIKDNDKYYYSTLDNVRLTPSYWGLTVMTENGYYGAALEPNKWRLYNIEAIPVTEEFYELKLEYTTLNISNVPELSFKEKIDEITLDSSKRYAERLQKDGFIIVNKLVTIYKYIQYYKKFDETTYLRYGVIDLEGKTIIPIKYDTICYNNGEFTAFFIEEDEKSNGLQRYCIIYNRHGQIVEKFENCRWVERIKNIGFKIDKYDEHGFNTLTGLIDDKKNVLIEPQYKMFDEFVILNNVFFKVSLDLSAEKFGIIDIEGKIRIPLEYKFFIYNEKYKIIFANSLDKTALYNTDFKLITQFKGYYRLCRPNKYKNTFLPRKLEYGGKIFTLMTFSKRTELLDSLFIVLNSENEIINQPIYGKITGIVMPYITYQVEDNVSIKTFICC